jgi:hypothetical protein
MTCLQILITVPELLALKLSNHSDSKWAQTLKYVIVDEVHNIIEVGRGSVYERVLAQIPCPVICLSATVGNASVLWRWLASLQQQKGLTMAPLVQISHRWNDLQLQIYAPQAPLRSVEDTARFGADVWQLGKRQKEAEGPDRSMVPVHPVGLFATQTGAPSLSSASEPFAYRTLNCAQSRVVQAQRVIVRLVLPNACTNR